MPSTAARYVASEVLAVATEDARAVAANLLAAGTCQAVAFSRPGFTTGLFVPDEPVTLVTESVEVSTSGVADLRRTMLHLISPAQLEGARSLRKETQHPTPHPAGKHADKRVSDALDLYASKYLPQRISDPKEIERVKAGIRLFIDMEGDLALVDVDADRLRSFRDVELSTLPARENQIRSKFKTTSMVDSKKAFEGMGWPLMSAAERDQRMQWIARLFRWLKDQGWISIDLCTALKGESVQSKAERKFTSLEKKLRLPFTDEVHRGLYRRREGTSRFPARAFAPFRESWWKLSPSMTMARSFSRRKMFFNSPAAKAFG